MSLLDDSVKEKLKWRWDICNQAEKERIAEDENTTDDDNKNVKYLK